MHALRCRCDGGDQHCKTSEKPMGDAELFDQPRCQCSGNGPEFCKRIGSHQATH